MFHPITIYLVWSGHCTIRLTCFSLESIAFYSETSHLIWQQTKWLISIWNATLAWNGFPFLVYKNQSNFDDAQCSYILKVYIMFKMFTIMFTKCSYFVLVSFKHLNLSVTKICIKYKVWTDEKYKDIHPDCPMSHPITS